MGSIALHGGGEFLPGDEPFIDALLRAAVRDAQARRSDATAAALRVVVLPTAAARGRPDLAASNAATAFQRRADEAGISIETNVARIVDTGSAADPSCAALLETADLIHLPGGDPDLIPALLRSSVAGDGLADAHRRGAVIAGASAGAMALAEWSWTAEGGVQGLGFVCGLAVVPHYNEYRKQAWQASFDHLAPDGLGFLGLDERTGVIADDGGWLVAGEGAAHWFARGSLVPVVARHGERIDRFC